MAEAGAWAVVQECLDAYHERRSATGGNFGGSVGSANDSLPVLLPRTILLLPEAGPALLSAYEARMIS